MPLFIFKILFILNSMSMNGKDKGRESKADSELSAEPYVGLHLKALIITTGAKTKSWMLNQMGHPGTPFV